MEDYYKDGDQFWYSQTELKLQQVCEHSIIDRNEQYLEHTRLAACYMECVHTLPVTAALF